jgi:hypothetical protein
MSEPPIQASTSDPHGEITRALILDMVLFDDGHPNSEEESRKVLEKLGDVALQALFGKGAEAILRDLKDYNYGAL